MAVVETRVALKVLAILYALATAFGFLASVPMVLHVYPQSECLLFSSQIADKFFYGHHAICNIIAYLFLFVVAGALYLLFKTWQEKKARAGQPTEKFEHQRIPKNIVTLHVVVFLAAALLTVITTAGYVSSCNNLHGDVSSNVKMKLNADPYDSRGKEIRDRQEDDYKFHRYNQNGKTIGSDFYNLRITCRSILTDPEIHQKLHDSHYDLQSRYYGYWYGTDLYAYDSQAEATKANGLVEASMAGGWLCLACWVGGLVLIFLQKFAVKQQTLDSNRRASEATMFGSNFNDSQPIATSGMEEPLKPGRKKFSNRGGSDRSRGDLDPMMTSSVANTSQQPLTLHIQQQPMMSYGPQDQMVLNQHYPQPNTSNWVPGYVVGPGNFAINPNFTMVGQPMAGFPQYYPNVHQHREEFETEIF